MGNFKKLYFDTVKMLILLLVLVVSVSACKPGKPKGVFTMEELKAQNKCPVEVTKASALMGVGNTALNTNPTIKVEFKNISDKKIASFTWVTVNFDKDGKLCTNWRGESGYAELQKIEPGESLEGQFFSSDPKTSKVRIIIKDIVYESKQGSYDILMKWSNKNLESEIEAAKSKK